MTLTWISADHSGVKYGCYIWPLMALSLSPIYFRVLHILRQNSHIDTSTPFSKLADANDSLNIVWTATKALENTSPYYATLLLTTLHKLIHSEKLRDIEEVLIPSLFSCSQLKAYLPATMLRRPALNRSAHISVKGHCCWKKVLCQNREI